MGLDKENEIGEPRRRAARAFGKLRNIYMNHDDLHMKENFVRLVQLFWELSN